MKRGSRKNNTEFPPESEYHCTVEWHLKGTWALALYTFAFSLSKKKGGSFFASKVNLAEHFGVNRSTIQTAAKTLVDSGFFKIVSGHTGQAVHYQVVSHKQWIQEHPGECCVKREFPWSGEDGDTLGVTLYAISGGRVKYAPHTLKALRNLGLDDDAIAKHFDTFMKQEIAERKTRYGGGRRWQAVTWKFLEWLERHSKDNGSGQVAV